MEIGAGDCELALAMARIVRSTFALDVSAEIAKLNARTPQSFNLVLFDGCDIPLPDASVDVAYSNQLMEHMHPDDVLEQLASIYRALVDGGLYICRTPNRLTGPHDISKYFDDRASGLHLKEYTNTELKALLIRAGFSRVATFGAVKGFRLGWPLPALQGLESFLLALPQSTSRKVARSRCVRGVLDHTYVVSTK